MKELGELMLKNTIKVTNQIGEKKKITKNHGIANFSSRVIACTLGTMNMGARCIGTFVCIA